VALKRSLPMRTVRVCPIKCPAAFFPHHRSLCVASAASSPVSPLGGSLDEDQEQSSDILFSADQLSSASFDEAQAIAAAGKRCKRAVALHVGYVGTAFKGMSPELS